MTLRLAQISAMTYYEMRMLWRQRLTIVFILSTLVLTSIMLIAVRTTSDAQYDSSLIESNTITLITLFWPMLYIQILLLGGLVVVDVMPRDRLWNVKPLIDGTPLTRLTYLLGKLGGAWLTISLSLGVILPIAGLMSWWVIGPYEVGPYLQMCLGGALPLALLHIGLCVPLTAFVPARRPAVAVVLLFGLACSLLGMITGALSEVNLWGLLNPGRPYLYAYFWLGWVDPLYGTSLGMDVVWLSIAVGIIECGALLLLAWLWLRQREGRA
jgi:hypothetical protein